jgi:hypothetical protein
VAEHLLNKDEENLGQLKKAAKKWRTEWKHQEKHGLVSSPFLPKWAVADSVQIHPLLQASEKTTISGDGPDDIGLRRPVAVDTALLDAPDAELAPVLEQLQRSLENMRGNHAHVDGIDGALKEAQAALDNVLFRNASVQQYATLWVLACRARR